MIDNPLFLPVIYSIATLLQVLAAAVVWLTNPNSTPHRGAALLIGFLALITFAGAQRFTAISYLIALPWLHVQVATAYILPPATYLASVAILRPAWFRHRWLYVPIALLMVASPLAVLADIQGLGVALYGQPFLFVPVEPTLFNNSLGSSSFATGLLGPVVGNFPSIFGTLTLICPSLVVLWVDRKRRPDTSATAGLFFIAAAIAAVSGIFLQGLVANLLISLSFTAAILVAGAVFAQSPVSLRGLTLSLNNLSLANKLLLAFAAIISSVLLLAAPITTATLQQANVQQSASQLQALANLTAANISADLDAQVSRLGQLGSRRSLATLMLNRQSTYASLNDPQAFIRDRDFEWRSGVSSLTTTILAYDRNVELLEFQQANPAYEQLIVVDGLGALVTATGATSQYDFSDTAWWSVLVVDMLNNRYVNVLDEGGQAPILELALPVYLPNNEMPVGAIYAQYRLISAQTDLARLAEALAGGVELRTADGSAVVLPAGNRLLAPIVNLQGLIVERRPYQVYPYANATEDSLVVALPVESTVLDFAEQAPSWWIVAHQPLSIALAPLFTWVQVGTAQLVIGLIVTASLIIGVARLIAAPLQQLTYVAGRVQQGDFTARAPLTGRDEFGQLAQTLNDMAENLQDLTANLEQRVTQRTQQLQTIIEMGQVATSELEIGSLLASAVERIRERFNFYQVSIFLVDESGENAIVRESTGEVGAIFKELSHSLRVGSNSVVGWATANRQPRVINDAAFEAAHFKNPLLPDTRSEAAIPLIYGDVLYGALDVQSTSVNIFGDEEIETLQAIANQIAIAINNATQFTRTQRTLEEVTALQSQYLRVGWADYVASSSEQLGFQQQGGSLFPLSEDAPLPPSFDRLDARRMALPLRVRGETLGVIELQSPPNRPWSQDDYALARAVIVQASLALENARLLNATRRSAEREFTVANISTRVRETLAVDAVLRTAVQEIGRQLGMAEVEVRLATPDEFEEDDGRNGH